MIISALFYSALSVIPAVIPVVSIMNFCGASNRAMLSALSAFFFTSTIMYYLAMLADHNIL